MKSKSFLAKGMQLKSYLIALIVFLPVLAMSATTVIGWSFNASLSSDSGISGNTGVAISTVGTGDAPFASSVGCPTGGEAICNKWTPGDYWVTASFKTTGYNTLTYSFMQARFQFGPAGTFKFQYSFDNATWVDIVNPYTPPQNDACSPWYTATDVALPAAMNDKPTVYLRWYNNDGTGTGGSRLEEVFIKGQAIGGGCTPPSFTACPGNTTVSTVSGTCAATVSYTATATGSPAPTITYSFSGATSGSGSGTGSGSSFNKGTTTVTITANNACSPNATCVFTITVNDNQAPTITCPGNMTMNNTTGSCGKAVTYTTPVGTDNCSGATTMQTTGLASGATFPVGVTTNTFKVTDASGNTATCSFTVSINDTEAPTITCPGNMTMSNGAGVCGKAVTYTTPVGTDNCPGATTMQTTGLSSGSTFPIGTTTNTFKVTDAAGNTATCSFTVTINDTEVPTITCPSNITDYAVTGVCGKVITYATPTATDNCSGVTVTHTGGLGSGQMFPVGVTTEIWKATDASGNTSTCSFTVTIIDDQDPIITGCPSSVTKNVNPGTCSTTHSWTAPTASDNCPGVMFSSNYAPGSSFPKGETTVVYTATDASGNTTLSTFTVTVIDNEMPTISGCPGNISVNTDPNVCTAIVSWTAPTAADNCMVSSFTSNENPGASFNVGTTTVTYTATDMSGNTKTCTFTVTVTDNQLPAINCPGNAMRGVNEGTCKYTINGTEFNATATDNCGIATLAYTLSGATTGTGFNTVNGIMLNTGITTFLWKATDVNGNMNTCSFTVEVKDMELPTITCPADKTVTTSPGQCTISGVALGTPTGVSDNCGVQFPITNNAPGTYGIGMTIVTWKVTDINGNTKTCTQKVTVNASTCGMPTKVLHFDTTQTSAKIKWLSGKCALTHQLRIRVEITPGVWGSWSAFVTSSSPLEHMFTGLTPGKFYHYQIRSNCSNKFSASINGWFNTKSAFGGGTQDRIAEEDKQEVENPIELNIIPNPARDYTTIQISGFEQGEKTVTMFNLYGKRVFSVKVGTDQNELELELSTLGVKTGVYLIRVSDEKKQKTEQLMIER